MVRTVGDVGAQGAGKNHSISGVHSDFPASDFLEQQFLGHVFLGEPIFTKHNGMRNANRLIQMVYEKRDVARYHATRCHFYACFDGFALMDLSMDLHRCFSHVDGSGIPSFAL